MPTELPKQGEKSGENGSLRKRTKKLKDSLHPALNIVTDRMRKAGLTSEEFKNQDPEFAESLDKLFESRAMAIDLHLEINGSSRMEEIPTMRKINRLRLLITLLGVGGVGLLYFAYMQQSKITNLKQKVSSSQKEIYKQENDITNIKDKRDKIESKLQFCKNFSDKCERALKKCNSKDIKVAKRKHRRIHR